MRVWGHVLIQGKAAGKTCASAGSKASKEQQGLGSRDQQGAGAGSSRP